MIAVRLQGGFGNQLFQYAAGRRLSLKHGTSLALDVSAYKTYKLHNFDLPHLPINASVINRTSTGDFFIRLAEKFNLKPTLALPRQGLRRLGVVCEQSFSFDDSVLALPDNVTLLGYWQSEKYFADSADIIRSELTPSLSDHPDLQRLASEMARPNSVAVHVRRGDYVSNPKALARHGLLGIDYYRKALDLFVERFPDLHVFFFSDEIEWVRSELKIDVPARYVDVPGRSNIDDLHLMSLCQHNIIANSSFSWWGAWLSKRSDKMVVAPRKWLNMDPAQYRDVIPERWIKI